MARIRLHTALLVSGLLTQLALPAAEGSGSWNNPELPSSGNRRLNMYPGANPTPPDGLDDEGDDKDGKKKKKIAPSIPPVDTKEGPEVRKVTAPADRYLYLSAKKLELEGGEDALDDAMSIYRMAVHNGAQGRALQEAYLGLARCEYARGNYWQAFRAVESSYPKEFDRAELDLRAQMEMDLGQLLQKQSAQKVGDAMDKDGKPLSGYQAAAQVYESVVYNDPKGPYTPTALRRRAQCLKELKDYDEAEKTYYTLSNTFPHSKENIEAKLELIELLALKTKDTGGIKAQDQDRVTDMIRQAKTRQESNDPSYKQKIEQAETALAENRAAARLQEAKFYIKRGGDKAESAAKFILEDILRLYPDTTAAKEARQMFDKLGGGKGGRNK